MLGELAELSLVVAKELAARLHASETPEEAVALAGAYHKVSRVVRLTLALDAKLERDAAREARAEAREAETTRIESEAAQAAEAERRRRQALSERAPHPVEAKKDRVRGLLGRLIWNESEGDSEEYEVLLDDLSARLDEAARDPAFLDLPVEILAGRMIADRGLSGVLTLNLREAPANDAGAPTPQTADTG